MPLTLLGHRFRHLWWLKAIGTTLFMYAFFAAYFHLLQHPAYPPTPTPITALDRYIPYDQWTWGVYASLWLYTSLPVSFQPDLRLLLYYGVSIFLLCATGLTCFYFFPSIIPADFLATYRGPQIALLEGVDAAGNAAPSLHVATAVFSMFWLRKQLLEVNMPASAIHLNSLWCIGIAYSTMSTKQHVLLDVITGTLLGVVFALLSLRLLNRFAPQRP